MMFLKFWNFGHDKNSSRRTPRPFKNVENGDFQPFLGHILGNRCWPNVTQGSEGHFKGVRDEKYDLWESENRIERLHTTSWVSPRYLYVLAAQKKTKIRVILCIFHDIAVRSENQDVSMNWMTRSSSGWVLMAKTFLQLKSMISEFSKTMPSVLIRNLVIFLNIVENVKNNTNFCFFLRNEKI